MQDMDGTTIKLGDTLVWSVKWKHVTALKRGVVTEVHPNRVSVKCDFTEHTYKDIYWRQQCLVIG